MVTVKEKVYNKLMELLIGMQYADSGNMLPGLSHEENFNRAVEEFYFKDPKFKAKVDTKMFFIWECIKPFIINDDIEPIDKEELDESNSCR